MSSHFLAADGHRLIRLDFQLYATHEICEPLLYVCDLKYIACVHCYRGGQIMSC